MTIEDVIQAGEDLLILPFLTAEKYYLVGFDTIKLVKPDGQVVEMNVDVSRFFARPPTDDYSILIPNTRKDDVPVGSQIWIA